MPLFINYSHLNHLSLPPHPPTSHRIPGLPCSIIKTLPGYPLTRLLVRPGTGCNFFPLESNLISRQFKPLMGASQVALVVKNPSASAGDIRDMGSIPGSGRSPGEGHGNPLQYSCLENPMDRGAWWATVHGVTKSWTRL